MEMLLPGKYREGGTACIRRHFTVVKMILYLREGDRGCALRDDRYNRDTRVTTDDWAVDLIDVKTLSRKKRRNELHSYLSSMHLLRPIDMYDPPM